MPGRRKAYGTGRLLLTRLGIGTLWLLHFLPLALLAPLGRGIGLAYYALGGRRRAVALTNLRLCFPGMDEAQREALARRHFQAVGRSLVERCIGWWSSRSRICRVVRFEGVEHYERLRGEPVIWLAPHFVGLDMGGARIIAGFGGASLYSRQKDPLVDRLLLRGRTRFGNSVLVSRQEGIRPLVKLIRGGTPFYYLPDMDLGPKESIFVPFFGVPAATVPALSRLARLTGAKVVPCVTRQLPGGQGYVTRFYPAWEDFPSDDVAADTRRMNAFIEERVLEMPEQYWWLHRRFKSRPPGQPPVYD